MARGVLASSAAEGTMADAPAGQPEAIHVMNGHEPPPHLNGQYAADRFRVERGLDSVVEDMDQVCDGGVIALYCGEAHPDVYSSAAFIQKALDVIESKRARISAITGPILLVPEDRSQTNGLVQLASDPALLAMQGKFRLYHRRARFTTGHFRVVETDHTYKVYRELPHAPGEDVSTRWCENMGRFTDAEIRAQARAQLDRFSAWKTMSVRHIDARAVGLPLVTTPSRLAKIVKHAQAKGLVFNALGPEQIETVAAEAGPDLIWHLASPEAKT